MELIEIKIESREITAGQIKETINARDLWTAIGSRQQYVNWLDRRIKVYGFVEGRDYLLTRSINQVPHMGGMRSRELQECYLTLECAKEFGMVEGTEKGREIRNYFIECERRAKAAAAAPVVPASQPGPSAAPFDPETFFNDPASMRNLLLNYTERLIRAEDIIKEQQPKVAALNRIAECTAGSLCISDAAKSLGVIPKVLFTWLQGHDWIFRRNGSSYKAYAPRLKQGFLEHKVSSIQVKNLDGFYEDKIVEQVRITPKGLTYLAEVFTRPMTKTQSANSDQANRN